MLNFFPSYFYRQLCSDSRLDDAHLWYKIYLNFSYIDYWNVRRILETQAPCESESSLVERLLSNSQSTRVRGLPKFNIERVCCRKHFPSTIVFSITYYSELQSPIYI